MNIYIYNISSIIFKNLNKTNIIFKISFVNYHIYYIIVKLSLYVWIYVCTIYLLYNQFI